MKKQFDIITFHPRRHHNFEQAARLAKVFANFKHLTGVYYSPRLVNFFSKFSKKLAKEMSRRSYNFPKGLVSSFPWIELWRVIKSKFSGNYDFNESHNQFGRWVVRNYVPPKIALGFDSLSREVFEAWKGKSFLVLDLVIGIPQYRAKLDFGEGFTRADLQKRSEMDKILYKIYDRELELADLILCGSEFVKKTCLEFDVPEEKLLVINYGVDIDRFKNENKIFNKTTENLRFAFVGAVGYRKGTDKIVEAWQNIVQRHPTCEMHFYGKVELDFPKLPNMYLHGAVNQLDLIEELKKADIFVFPSTFEGSAYSIYQACAMKLAVITTENSGSVLHHNESAIIIEIGNPKKIEEAMEQLILNPEKRITLAENAFREANKYTWDYYGERLVNVFQNILKKN